MTNMGPLVNIVQPGATWLSETKLDYYKKKERLMSFLETVDFLTRETNSERDDEVEMMRVVISD